MSFFKHTNETDILLSSNIEYLNSIAYFSLDFKKNGKCILKSKKILSVSQTSICFYIEKRYEFIMINEESEEQIKKLQTLFKYATDFELSFNINNLLGI